MARCICHNITRHAIRGMQGFHASTVAHAHCFLCIFQPLTSTHLALCAPDLWQETCDQDAVEVANGECMVSLDTVSASHESDLPRMPSWCLLCGFSEQQVLSFGVYVCMY
jgi:hypothetical protein